MYKKKEKRNVTLFNGELFGSSVTMRKTAMKWMKNNCTQIKRN